MVTKENEAFVLGGSWRIPVLHKLLDPNFVDELKEDGTYNPLSFDREYESIWTGSGEGGFFNEDLITRNRVIKKAELEPDFKVKDKDKYEIFYMISVDVATCEGNENANSVVLVGKCKRNLNTGKCITNIVNMSVIHGEHFEKQAIEIKKLFFKYEARMCSIDLNGLGVGLGDFMVKENIDENGEVYPPFSFIDNPDYDKYKTKDSIEVMYSMKSQGIAGAIHVNCLSQISSGKVKFLIDEMEAKTQLTTQQKKEMGGGDISMYLIPYLNTTILKDEMLNLKSKPKGKYVELERMNNKIQKDRFSALEYMLWYVKMIEDDFKEKEEESWDNAPSFVTSVNF